MAATPDIPATRAFGAKVDFGKTSSDYRAFRAGFPDEFFQLLAARNWALPGQRALDIGTGTGTIAQGLTEMGLSVRGLDPAEALLSEARAISETLGLTIDYRVGSAEHLPDADDSLDLITAGQCWHWFDRAKAAAEAMRVLVPGGRIIIAHFDWLPVGSNVVEATEALILAHNPAWTLGGGNGLYPAWLRDMAEAAFANLETASFDVPVIYSHAAWRGRIRASAGVKASLDGDAIDRFDAALAAMLRDRFPADPLSIPHRVWMATGIKSAT